MQKSAEVTSETNRVETHREDAEPFLSKFLFWLCLYLLIAGGLSTALAILMLVNTYFPADLLQILITLFSLGVPFILVGIGIASLLPLSEYTYVRQAGTNPTMAREITRHMKKGPDKKEFGILLGIAGATGLFKISPWDLFLFGSMPVVGIQISTLIMTLGLALLILFYKGKLAKRQGRSQ